MESNAEMNDTLTVPANSLPVAGRNGCGARQDLKVYVSVFSEDQLHGVLDELRIDIPCHT